MELREAHGLTGAVFTPETYMEVRQWVQDRSTFGEIVATPTRLYLPVGISMAQVDENDIIWWDPEGGDNAFSIERLDPVLP